jgi:predicted PurR-regulated permease PerM
MSKPSTTNTSKSIASQISHSLGAYLKATLKNAIITNLLFVIGFAIAGVPWWPLTGLLCGTLNLLPHLGPILSLGLGLVIQYFASEDWTRMAIVGGVWLAIQILDGFVLSPGAAGRAGVSPILSIFLVLAAGLIFGPIGMILAVPVTAIILIITKAFRPKSSPTSR